MNAEKLAASLNAVRALFIERYRLSPSDDSAGLRSIERAIAAGPDVSIANLRSMLSQYNLYPQYEVRMADLLSDAEAALSEQPEESPATAQIGEAPVSEEPASADADAAPVEPEPTPITRATRVRTPKSEE